MDKLRADTCCCAMHMLSDSTAFSTRDSETSCLWRQAVLVKKGDRRCVLHHSIFLLIKRWLDSPRLQFNFRFVDEYLYINFTDSIVN